MQFTGIALQTVLLGAAIAAAIVTVLYVLKLRKRRIEVPFSGLWARVIEEQSRQSNLWRRLRRLFSWLLHLLILGLLAFGLLDPHFEDEIVEGRHIALLVDNSASMAATDVAGGADRLDVGRKKALEVLDTIGPEDRIMLASFNSQVHPRTPFVSDPMVLEQPIRDIEVQGTGTSFEEALSFAADSLRGKERAELVVVSDGAGFDPEKLENVNLGEETTVRHVQLGESGENLAITGFNVRRYVANKLDYELFVRVQNYFDRSIEANLEIFADGRMVDSKPLRLEPGATEQRFYPSQAVSGERLEARIKLESRDARDIFPLDNRAYALLPKMSEVQVQLVTDENLYLEGTLLLNPNVDVTTMAPSDWDAGSTRDYDITVFDRFTPPAPEKGNFLYVAPSGEDSPWKVVGTEKEPIVTSVKRSHPLMRWITLKDLNIGSTQKVQLQRNDVRVASSIETPLFVSRDEGERKLGGIMFDVRDSDLPLRVAFPMLMFNLVDYFSLDDSSYIPNYVTGRSWSVDLPKGADSASVTAPDGERFDAPVFEQRAVFRGAQPGFYTIRTPEGNLEIAANLSDPVESDPAPATIEFGEGRDEADPDALFFDRREIWIWAVLVAALLLLAEWVTYNRRITV